MRSPLILRVFKQNQLVEVKQFDVSQVVIGSGDDVQLKLTSDHISPIHCMIELRDSGYYLCDLGSQSGTFKNGQAILDEKIESSDEMVIGDYKIVFFVGVPKPKTAPASTPIKTEPAPEAVTTPAPVAAPAAKTAPVVTVTPVPEVIPATKVSVPVQKPEIRTTNKVSYSSKKKNSKTYAPPSEIRQLRDYLRPVKGQVLEVIVAWKERVLQTYHFRTKGIVRVGRGLQVEIPDGSFPQGWPLLQIENGVKVSIPESAHCELVTTQGNRGLGELLHAGKASRSGGSTSIRLEQNEMLMIAQGDGLSLYIRYAPQSPVVPMLPPLMLSGSELTGVIMSLVIVAVMAFYISATTPKDLNETQQEQVTRVAQVIFNKPPEVAKTETPPPPPPPPEKTPTPPPPVKAKVSDQQKEVQKKGQPTDQKKAAQNQVAARASEVAPIPNSQNRRKTFTSTKQGGAIKLGEKAGANAQSAKDVTKMGLFSAFGAGGSRSKLDTAYSGAGEILGQAEKATGTSGMGVNRAGDDLGSKFKDTGAGGKGTATQGIAGIGTKGRGSGQSAYGADSGFGDKTTVAITPGGAEEDFVGTIDREAVRRRVRHYLHEIRGCYVRELNKLEKGQSLVGKVVVSWEIIEKGIPRNVRIKSSELGNKNVENCIRDRLASWSFPEPPVGMTAEVSFPFYFRPEN